MFKRLFKKRKRKLTKLETIQKFELFELFDDLEQAAKILSQLSGGDSGEFQSAEEFYEVFVEEINDLEYQNVPDFSHICLWFAATSVWDDLTGKDYIELGNRIYERAHKWNKVHY